MTKSTACLADHSLETSRNAIARLIPDAMERAVASYRGFVAREIPLEAKDFKDHHLAGRTALAHLEALLRLARWTAVPAGETDDDLDALLTEASRALTALRGEAE